MKIVQKIGHGQPVLEPDIIDQGGNMISMTGNCPYCHTKLYLCFAPSRCNICQTEISWRTPKGWTISAAN